MMTLRSTVIRVRGICARTIQEARDAVVRSIDALTQPDENLQSPTIEIVPACDDDRDDSYVALLDFIELPQFLHCLNSGQGPRTFGDLTFDRDFEGLTQLYPCSRTPIADLIFIPGIGGHAYGSWASKNEPWSMWPRHFLKDVLPDVRVMTYGYDTRLTRLGYGGLLDYTLEFMHALDLARYRVESDKLPRPIIFVAHSFGGNIVKYVGAPMPLRDLNNRIQCLIRSSQTDRRILKATRGIIFFAVPHRGMDFNDMLQVLNDGQEQRSFLQEINHWRILLEPFMNLISQISIASFYELKPIRRLTKDPEGRLLRNGEPDHLLLPENATLGLPDSMEKKYPISRDHSDIVKFDNRHGSFTQALSVIRNFIDSIQSHLSSWSGELGPSQNSSSVDLPIRGSNLSEGLQGNLDEMRSSSESPNLDSHHALEEHHTLEEVDLNCESMVEAAIDTEDVTDNSMLGAEIVDTKGKSTENSLKIVDNDILATMAQRKLWTAIRSLLEGEIQLRNPTNLKPRISNSVLNNVGVPNSVILLASYLGLSEFLSILFVDTDTEVDAMDDNGKSPLILAAAQGHDRTVTMLVEQQAKLDEADKSGWTALMYAARYRHTGAVSVLVGKGANPSLQNSMGETALMLVASRGSIRLLKVLIRTGGCLDIQNSAGQTALMLAAKYSDRETVEVLVKEGALLDLQDIDKSTVLMMAASDKSSEVVKVLVEAGAQLDLQNNNRWTALMMAARNNNDSEVVKVLVEAGARLDHQNIGKWTALMMAAGYNNSEVVKVLVEAGAQLDLQNIQKWTALMMAVSYNNSEVVKVLVEAGAQLDLRHHDNRTALMMAAGYNSSEAVKVLIEAGAQSDLQNIDKLTALMMAARYNNDSEVVKVLVEAGAQLDIQDIDKRSALMLAARYNNNSEVMKVLVEAGAQLDIQDINKSTVLMMAASDKSSEVVKVLVEAGAQLDLQNNNRWTALMMAARNNNDSEVVKVLVEAGARLDFQSIDKWTPLMYASEMGHLKTVELLLKKGAHCGLRTTDRENVLDIAERCGQREVLKLLEKHVPKRRRRCFFG